MLESRSTELSRRGVVVGFAASAIGLGTQPAAAAIVRRLSLLREDTGEAVAEVAFWRDGAASAAGLSRLDWLMRDVRADQVAEIDVRLYYLLWAMQTEFGGRTIVVTSGYRTKATNAGLLRRGIDVARNSYHLAGRAADLKVDGVPVARVAGLGRRLGLGGVGRYPTFVHLDTGPARSWAG